MAYSDEYDAIMAQMYDGDYEVVSGGRPRSDIGFYVEEAAQNGGPVLEIGCGTGRILLPTAEAGIEIDGIDHSPEMLRIAHEKLAAKNLSCRLERADMRDFDLGKKYSLITIPFRAFCHMETVEDHFAALACVKKHLAPDGIFIFDFYQMQPVAFTKFSQDEVLQIEREQDGKIVRRYAHAKPNLAIQTSAIRFRWEVEDEAGEIEEFISDFKMRWVHRYEVEHLLARAGFELLHTYGDFDRSELSHESPEMVFVSRAAV
ncbi:MAG: class I SAM-dependent methyltransferase [Planctomycetota bacterium]